MSQPSQKAAMPQVGDLLGDRYRLLKQVNRGAQAVVFKAESLSDQRPVAIKLSTAGPIMTGMLQRELAILQALKHIPGVVDGIEFQSEGAIAWLVMEWVEGVDGKLFIENHRPMEWQTWLWVARSLTSALWSCHTLGFLHMDVKPQNILFGKDGDFRIADFGISTHEGFVTLDGAAHQKGTLFYMAPEQVLDGLVHPAGEVFSVGVTLYEFLTGSPPFQAEDPGLIQAQKAKGDFIPATRLNLNAPLWVDEFFNLLLHPNPTARPGGMRELLAMLSHEKVVSWREKTRMQACGQCGGELWEQLPICSRCGLSFKLRPEKGNCQLLLWQLTDKGRFVKKVEALAERTLPPWRRYLIQKTFPRMLLRGVDPSSARLIADALSDDNSQVHLTSRLLYRMNSTALSPMQALTTVLCIILPFLVWNTEMAVPGAVLFFVGLGLVAYSTMSQLIPASFFLSGEQVKPWSILTLVSQKLTALQKESSRERASLLVRRGKLLSDDLLEARIGEVLRDQIGERLGAVILHGLDALLDMEAKQTALRELHCKGIGKKKKEILAALARERDAFQVNAMLSRLEDLEKSEMSILALEARLCTRETTFANILSTLNGLYLERSSAEADLSNFEELNDLLT